MQEALVRQYQHQSRYRQSPLDGVFVQGANIQPSSLMKWYQKYNQQYSIPLNCVPDLLQQPYQQRWQQKTSWMRDGSSKVNSNTRKNKERITVETLNIDKLQEILTPRSVGQSKSDYPVKRHRKLEKEYKGLHEMLKRSVKLVENHRLKSLNTDTKDGLKEELIPAYKKKQMNQLIQKQPKDEYETIKEVTNITEKKRMRSPKIQYLKPEFGISQEERNARLLHVVETKVLINKARPEPIREDSGDDAWRVYICLESVHQAHGFNFALKI